MKTQQEALEFLRGWFDRLGGVSYVHHDSATETTVDARLDLSSLAADLVDAMNQVRAAERERCAAWLEMADGNRDQREHAAKLAALLRRA